MMILTPFSRYPEFLFISDNEASKLAGLNHRYSEASLHGIISDIELLSESDFVVCTFSSQVLLLILPSLFYVSIYIHHEKSNYMTKKICRK